MTLPKKNNTSPVTTHALMNSESSLMPGNADGKMAYPNNGKVPKNANDENIITPAEKKECQSN